MEIYDLNILEKSKSSDNLYDMTLPTFNNISGYAVYQHTVEPQEEMRIDLISKRRMGSTDYIDFLLNFNRIDNPLNIKSGDLIFYIDSQSVGDFRIKPKSVESIKSQLFDPSKVSQVDKSRRDYIENNYSLPPTIMSNPINSVKVVGDSIIIGVDENRTF